MTNSGCGYTFHDHVVPLLDSLLSCLISSKEPSHDALEMTKDLKENPLALRGLASSELEESLVPPSLELEVCLVAIKHEKVLVPIVSVWNLSACALVCAFVAPPIIHHVIPG